MRCEEVLPDPMRIAKLWQKPKAQATTRGALI